LLEVESRVITLGAPCIASHQL